MACLVGRTIEALIRLLACVFPLRMGPCLGEARISVVTVAGPLLTCFTGSSLPEKWSLIDVIWAGFSRLQSSPEAV